VRRARRLLTLVSACVLFFLPQTQQFLAPLLQALWGNHYSATPGNTLYANMSAALLNAAAKHTEMVQNTLDEAARLAPDTLPFTHEVFELFVPTGGLPLAEAARAARERATAAAAAEAARKAEAAAAAAEKAKAATPAPEV
jgi:hypothetical protein